MEEVWVPLRQRSVGLSDALHRLHRRRLAYVSEGKLWVNCLSVKTSFSCPDCGIKLWTMSHKELLFLPPSLSLLNPVIFRMPKCLKKLLINIKILIIRLEFTECHFFLSKPLRTQGHLQQNSSVSALITLSLLKVLFRLRTYRWLKSAIADWSYSGFYYYHRSSLSRMFNGQLFFSFYCTYLQI